MDQPLVPFDLHRMFLGDWPLLFLLEIVFRCAVIYTYTLLLLRWVGGRSVTQLSLVEFLLVIALGSAVGDALFYPEVPLIHAMLVITVIVLVNKLLDQAILRWESAKRIVDGDPVKVVEDGRILPRGLRRRAMGHAELTAALRNKGIRNLGQLEAVYMEANGTFSVFLREVALPGLCIAPPHELEHPGREQAARGLCCLSCGLVLPGEGPPADGICPECGHDGWTRPRLL